MRSRSARATWESAWTYTRGSTMSAPETAAALTRTDRGPQHHSPPRGQHRCRTALRAGTPRPLASRVGTWLHASPACRASWECLNTATFSAGTAIQDFFPHLTPAQREFIITGTTAEEWATLPEE